MGLPSSQKVSANKFIYVLSKATEGTPCFENRVSTLWFPARR
jgi:hypothetical protein